MKETGQRVAVLFEGRDAAGKGGAIKRFMDEEAKHPKTHMMTNIYVDETESDVKLYFRIVALQSGGLTGTASYYDDVVKTPVGWRVQHRVVTLRRR